jgi:transketolase
MMTESHRLMSKYHTSLLTYSNGHLAETTHTREELKNLRSQSFLHIKQSLDKLLPQIDQ